MKLLSTIGAILLNYVILLMIAVLVCDAQFGPGPRPKPRPSPDTNNWQSDSPGRCAMLFDTTLKKPNCGKAGGLANLLQMTNAYCYNDGSGLCKAFSGQFEYKFNTKTKQFLGKVEPGPNVDEFGYHNRIPVNYDVDGNINYADQSINWARQWAGVTNKGNLINLLSINDFNWCAFVKSNYWPYKSAIRKGPFRIYFFNRQSCIFKDGVEDKKQHYNTRFLHLSQLRIDIDINPTIFAMEDFDAKGDRIRLVKHKRQHWYEVEFEVLEGPTANITYFVKMKDTETLPSLIKDASGPLLNSVMLSNHTNICLSDEYQDRADGAKNGRLVEAHCGYDPAESVDFTVAEYTSKDRAQAYQVDLHCLPYYPEVTQTFFGVNIRSKEYWENFGARIAFTALTSIPTKGNPDEVRVLMMYAKYGSAVPQDVFDEFYPKVYFADFKSRARRNPQNGAIEGWNFNRDAAERYSPNLNYVDDIAYLHLCDSILVIFGPLYTEMKAADFSIDKKTTVGPIYELGIQEPVNAFFAEPGQPTLWVYHRLNWIVKHTYSCGDPANGQLVTATRSDPYRHRQGGRPSVFAREIFRDTDHKMSEEYLWKLMGIFKGSLKPEAPDANNYPLPELPVPPPPRNIKDYTWVYILIGVGVLLILLLCVVCIFTLRRRATNRRRAQRGAGPLGSQVSGTPTTRSGLGSKSGSSISSTKTGRSSLHAGSSRSSLRPKLTERSANYGSPRTGGVKIPSRVLQSGMQVKPGRSVRSALSANARSSQVSRSPTLRSSRLSTGSQNSQKLSKKLSGT